MLFDSGVFAIFIIVVMLVYYSIGDRLKLPWILLSSVVFYMWVQPLLVAIPFFLIAVSYTGGMAIGSAATEKKKTVLLTCCIILQVAILVFYKYSLFIGAFLLQLLAWIGMETAGKENILQEGFFATLIVPLGISYIVFQSIGYLIDIKRGDLLPEKKMVKFSTYLLFFPKIIAGPVESASHFLPQLNKPAGFHYNNVTDGIRQMAWGLFKKFVIANRLTIFVDYVYSDLHSNQGVALLIALIVFPIQLYADFSGYTDMALGTAKMLGYDLSINFNRPFAAKSMVEFWRRWHISLSTWVNKYVYTPISINKRDWGKWGAVYASLVTFLILGLWHGPNWTFVVFGLINGFFIAIEFFTTRERKKLRKQIPESVNTAGGILYVFFAFALACVFFRSSSVKEAGYFLSNLFTGEYTTAGIKTVLQSTGLHFLDYVVCLIAVPFMFYVERTGLVLKIAIAPKMIRWSVYYIFLIVVMAYGVSSGAGFIYQQF